MQKLLLACEMYNYNKQIFNSYYALGITVSIRDLKKLIVSSARSVWEGSTARVVCWESPVCRAGFRRMIILIINEGWDPFYDQNIEHKINKHPVMTVINGNGIQLVGMSEEKMNVRHVPGAACLHTHRVCAHALTATGASLPGLSPCRLVSMSSRSDQGLLPSGLYFSGIKKRLSLHLTSHRRYNCCLSVALRRKKKRFLCDFPLNTPSRAWDLCKPPIQS